ncbi:MAG: phosphatase family protein [Ignavibacteria bacterium]|nr:phosphatase family protein [Ignavibacteria bacterium]
MYYLKNNLSNLQGCHSERSEESSPNVRNGFFTSFRMTFQHSINKFIIRNEYFIKNKYLFILFFLYFCQSLCHAQNPYRINKERDITSCILITANLFESFYLDSKIEPMTENQVNGLKRSDLWVIDRSATYNYSSTALTTSDILVAGLCASPLLLLINNYNSRFTELGFMTYEVFGITGFLQFYAKAATTRARPYTYNPEVSLSEKITSEARRSFFSAHTAFAFATAVYISTVYSDYEPDSKYKYYVWAGTLGLAGTIGFLRWYGGAHFPTDILTGAVIGSAIGYLVPLAHRKDNVNSSWQIGPGLAGNNLLFNVICRF